MLEARQSTQHKIIIFLKIAKTEKKIMEKKRQPKNRQQKIVTGKFNNEKMTGVGKKANVKLVFRRESNSLFRLQKQWHGLGATYVTTLVLKSYQIHRLQ